MKHEVKLPCNLIQNKGFQFKNISKFVFLEIQHQESNWYAYLIKNLTGARKASETLFLKVNIKSFSICRNLFSFDFLHKQCFRNNKTINIITERQFL